MLGAEHFSGMGECEELEEQKGLCDGRLGLLHSVQGG